MRGFGFGRHAAVSRDHDYAHSRFVQERDRFHRRGLDGVRYTENPSGPAAIQADPATTSGLYEHAEADSVPASWDKLTLEQLKEEQDGMRVEEEKASRAGDWEKAAQLRCEARTEAR
jgi:hypothetical protein